MRSYEFDLPLLVVKCFGIKLDPKAMPYGAPEEAIQKQAGAMREDLAESKFIEGRGTLYHNRVELVSLSVIEPSESLRKKIGNDVDFFCTATFNWYGSS